MLLSLYTIATWLVAPLAPLYIQRRVKQGKEDSTRIAERLGRSGLPRPAGNLVWVHAASVGEALSVLDLIRRIGEEYAGTVLVTTGTVTSARLLESRLPECAFHQYIPLDEVRAVRRFLNHWQPNLAVWVESEFWPNLITETRRRCPMVSVNARISEDSFKFWQRFPGIIAPMLRCFSLCLPQTEKDAERLRALGMQKVRCVGNLKSDAPPLPADPKKMGELITMIGERPLWMATSTHEGEEEDVAEIHEALQEEYPTLLTIIAPRHPDRAKSILEKLRKRELNVAQRSIGEPITDATDIYLADTMGELGLLYRIAPIVFIGGTLVPHGGQNPLEACRLECSVLWGPFMDNFLDIAGELQRADAAIAVKDKNALKEAVDRLLTSPLQQEAYAKAALEVASNKTGVLEAVMAELAPHLNQAVKQRNAKVNAA